MLNNCIYSLLFYFQKLMFCFNFIGEIVKFTN
nr:MAG TPA: hypothetical protein [Caudoviricetes sp.]